MIAHGVSALNQEYVHPSNAYPSRITVTVVKRRTPQ